MSTETITIIGWSLVGLLMFGMIIRLIVGTIQSYRQQKKYLPNMKVGDSVWFPTSATDIYGVVEEIDGDLVKVSLTIRKDRLHSNQKPGE